MYQENNDKRRFKYQKKDEELDTLKKEDRKRKFEAGEEIDEVEEPTRQRSKKRSRSAKNNEGDKNTGQTDGVGDSVKRGRGRPRKNRNVEQVQSAAFPQLSGEESTAVPGGDSSRNDLSATPSELSQDDLSSPSPQSLLAADQSATLEEGAHDLSINSVQFDNNPRDAMNVFGACQDGTIFASGLLAFPKLVDGALSEGREVENGMAFLSDPDAPWNQDVYDNKNSLNAQYGSDEVIQDQNEELRQLPLQQQKMHYHEVVCGLLGIVPRGAAHIPLNTLRVFARVYLQDFYDQECLLPRSVCPEGDLVVFQIATLTRGDSSVTDHFASFHPLLTQLALLRGYNAEGLQALEKANPNLIRGPLTFEEQAALGLIENELGVLEHDDFDIDN